MISRYSILFSICVLLLTTACQQKNNKPNVLLVTLDTLRADALGCYGNTTVSTPVLNKIAEEGALFENAICQIPATLASHTAIMTGCNPMTTGVRFGKAHVPDSVQTLAEKFSDARYETAAFISSMVLAPFYGLNQGFSRYDMGNLGDQIFERRAEATIDSAVAFAEGKHAKPFFMWVHLYDPHSPYDAPAPYTRKYDPDYQGPLRGSVGDISKLLSNQGESSSEKDLQHLRARYWGEVSYMDFQLGRLFDALRKQNILDKTIVAVIADHGENLGEKQRFFHGDDLYWPSTHIPLLIRYPGIAGPKTRVAGLVQSIDVYPSLLELCRIDAKKKNVDGQSLVPLLTNSQDGRAYDALPGYMETEADPLCDANKLFGLRTKDFLFIYSMAHRRPETPVGIRTEIPIKGPTIVMMRIKGDPAVRLLVHIRYRTKDLYTSRDVEALSKMPSTVLNAESFGTDPLHQQAVKQTSFLPTADGWRLHATSDLFHWARSYGIANGWPTEWMVLEGVGVDASIPYTKQQATFTVDQIELYAPQLKFPNSPRFRNPFWVIADFEDPTTEGLIDSNSGPAHSITSRWLNEKVFDGNRQQEITITFKDTVDPLALDELYALSTDRNEEKNCIRENPAVAEEFLKILDARIGENAGKSEVIEISPGQKKALESLGYIK